MDKIKIFSLRRHSHLFAVPDNSADYLFLQAENHPYLEEPYRAESYGLAYVKEGSIHLQAGLSKYLIEAPAMITLAPSMIRSFSKSSEVMKMDILFFKDSFLSEGNRNLFFLMEYEFFEKAELCVVPLSGDLLFKVATIFQLLGQNQSSSALHYTAICRNYLLVLIYELDAHHRNRHQHDQEAEQIHPIVARFRKLLTSSYMLERKLDFYADQMNVTAKYLSAAVKKHTGKSAAQWIDESLTLEAKVLLQNINLTVSQISNRLNFADQSTFGKFFKANTGVTPIQYRKML